MRSRIFFWLCVGFVLFSLVPTWYELSHQNAIRPDRQFELIHNFYTDYNFYLSRIRQGIEGATTVLEKYTSEPHQGSFVQIFYLALGWAGSWTRTPWGASGDVYQAARIVLALTLLLLIVRLAQRIFANFTWQLVAFFLAVTASTWPKLVWEQGAWRFGGYMPWWSVMDSLQRITFIPHLLAGQSLIIFLLMALSDEKVLTRWGNWLFLGGLAFGLGIIFPPGLLFVWGVLGALVVLEVVWSTKTLKQFPAKALLLYRIAGRATVVVISAPALLYLNLMLTFYPWKRLAEFDVLHPLPFNYVEYAQALGPLLPLGVLGLVLVLMRREKTMLVAAAWVLAWLAYLVIFRFIPQQSPLRFSEMMPHLPLAMLAAYLFLSLTRAAVGPRFAHQSTPKHFLLFAVNVIMVTTIALGLGVMYSSWLWQRDFVDHKIRASYPLVPTGSYVMYPLKDFISAIIFIQDATSRDTAILSETTAGNYIPVYSGNTVYVGHDNTVKAEEKKELVRQFFGGTMDPVTALRWLDENNLKVVFFGPQEREDGGIQELSAVYPFLQPVYGNATVTVYALKQ